MFIGLLLAGVLWAVVTAIDVSMFFVLVRLVRGKLTGGAPWLSGLDQAGRSVVEGLVGLLKRGSREIGEKGQEGGKLIMCLLTLWVCRVLVVTIATAVMNMR